MIIFFLCLQFNGVFIGFLELIRRDPAHFGCENIEEELVKKFLSLLSDYSFGQKKRLVERVYRSDHKLFFSTGSTEILSSGLLVDNTEVLSGNDVFCSVCVSMLKHLLILIFVIWMVINSKLKQLQKQSWYIS